MIANLFVKDNAKGQVDPAEVGLIHHPAPGLLGWHTLCGHVDRTDYQWSYTRKAVTCRACKAVVAHCSAIAKEEGRS